MSTSAVAKEQVAAEYQAYAEKTPKISRWSLADDNDIRTQLPEPARQKKLRTDQSEIRNHGGIWFKEIKANAPNPPIDQSRKEIIPIERIPGRLIEDFEREKDVTSLKLFVKNWHDDKLGMTRDECVWILQLYKWRMKPEAERGEPPVLGAKVKDKKAQSVAKVSSSRGVSPFQQDSLSQASSASQIISPKATAHPSSPNKRDSPIRSSSASQTTFSTATAQPKSPCQQDPPLQASLDSQTIFSKAAAQPSNIALVSEQVSWMKGPDISQLRQEYEGYLTPENEDTRMFPLAKFALQVFRQAKSASVYIPPGSQALLGHGNADIDTADYFAMIPDDADRELLEDRNAPIIIKHSMASRNRPRIDEAGFFAELEEQRNAYVDIQDFGKSLMDGSSTQIEVGECIERLRNIKPISRESLPLNLLNLDDNTPNMVPASLCHNRFNILRNVCTEFRSSQLNNVGKPSYEWIHADITNSIQFRIYGQRGCVSGFHVDQLGGGTWVTQEGEGVKAWVILSRLTDKQQKKFETQGSNWLPDGDLPVIFVLPGDTLIMRPGRVNAHAVITVRSSLMTGGMFWDAHKIYSILSKWSWTNTNPAVSNEDPPKQTEGVLRLLVRRLKNSSNPRGIFPDVPGMDAFEEKARLVCLPVGKCNCRKRAHDHEDLCGCRSNARCGCSGKGIGCGTRCHAGGPCNNPVTLT